MIAWRRRASKDGLLFVVLGVALLATIPFILSAPTATGAPRTLGSQGFLAVVMVLFSAGFTYAGLVMGFNETEIVAAADKITQVAKPFWEKARVDLPTAGVKQFFAVSARQAASAFGSALPTNTVCVIDFDDHVRVLATAAPSSFAAHQIAHELNAFYGIPELPIFGFTTDPSRPDKLDGTDIAI